jgi:hypothetical protein
MNVRRIGIVAGLAVTLGVGYASVTSAANGGHNAASSSYLEGKSHIAVGGNPTDPPPGQKACTKRGKWICGLSSIGMGAITKDPLTTGVFNLACQEFYELACSIDHPADQPKEEPSVPDDPPAADPSPILTENPLAQDYECDPQYITGDMCYAPPS